MKVMKGQALTAPKLMIYGLSGVGKSSLAAKLNKPLFMDFEGGLYYLGVDRSAQYLKLEDFYKDLVELYHAAEGGKKEYDTIVIDSVDWLVRKVIEQAAGIDKNNLEMTLNKSNGGYGNGKAVLENHIRAKLLPLLVALNKVGYGVCLIAHADRKILMDEDGIDTDRVAPKIDVNTMNIFVEWSDQVFYLKKKADGERILVLDGDDNVLAKNRLGLHGEVNLNDIDINELLIPKEEK